MDANFREAFAGSCALVVGLGREGTTLTRFLAERGARVTVTDLKSAEALAENMAVLAHLEVTYALGSHPLALLDGIDIVFVSPGVPLEIPLLSEARRRDVPLSSETRVFTRYCPAPVVGITGSSGKTTTTAWVAEMLKTAGRSVWVGGNIGYPLIGHLEEIGSTDTVVMELSSFQLEFFAPQTSAQAGRHLDESAAALFDRAGWSPPIAAVLNITPDHLDRHPSIEAYVAAKFQILAHQEAGDLAILNLDNPITRQMGDRVENAQVLWFSREQEVARGAFLQGDALTLRWEGREEVICRTGELRTLGQHNIANALAACTLACATGVAPETIRQSATTFTGVEHRLELVREWHDVQWYDDSIATAPERTVAALQAFPDRPIVLLAGGRDKHLPWEEMAALTWQRVSHLILFGEAAELIERAMRSSRSSARGSCCIRHAGTMEGAVELAAQVAQAGAVVLLSPGGTSFDAYQDYAARGDHFQQLVKGLN